MSIERRLASEPLHISVNVLFSTYEPSKPSALDSGLQQKFYPAREVALFCSFPLLHLSAESIQVTFFAEVTLFPSRCCSFFFIVLFFFFMALKPRVEPCKSL